MLYPGDYISSVEEYLPGFGVYATKDDLRSSNLGELQIDKERHLAKLQFQTRVPKMQGVGTITLGLVTKVAESFALLNLVPFYSKSFVFVPRSKLALLDVSKIKMGYVKNVSECVRVGDIVRIKIIEVTNDNVKVTTDEKNLGVVKAFCINCRKELKGKGQILICDNCKTKQFRKTAFDYGSGKVI